MATLTELEIDEVSLVDVGANPGANILLYKRKEKKMTLDEAMAALPEEGRAAVLAAIESTKAEVAVATEAVAVAEAAVLDKALVSVDAGVATVTVDVELSKKLEAAELETIALKKRLAELQETADRKDALSKAAAYGAVPGAGNEDLADLLFESAVLPVRARETLLSILSSTNKAVGSLLVPAGQEVQSFEGGTAEDQIDGLVKAVQQRDGLPRHQAMAKVCAAHPDLYRQYRADKQKTVKGKV
jgi:hypothetical protein